MTLCLQTYQSIKNILNQIRFYNNLYALSLNFSAHWRHLQAFQRRKWKDKCMLQKLPFYFFSTLWCWIGVSGNVDSKSNRMFYRNSCQNGDNFKHEWLSLRAIILVWTQWMWTLGKTKLRKINLWGIGFCSLFCKKFVAKIDIQWNRSAREGLISLGWGFQRFISLQNPKILPCWTLLHSFSSNMLILLDYIHFSWTLLAIAIAIISVGQCVLAY